MMRILVTAIIVLVGVTWVMAGDLYPRRTVDLNKPGALEAVQHNNPVHYEKIHEIMAGLFKLPDKEVPRWIQTSFNARYVSYSLFLMTSEPPKKRLSFVLDYTRYRALVTLTHWKGKIVPAE